MLLNSLKMAERAHSRVKAIRDNVPVKKQYRTIALDFPVRLRHSGLTQALGYLLSKETVPNDYRDHLAALSMENNTLAAIHELAIQSQRAEYQNLTRLVTMAADALKKYTQALMDVEEKSNA